VLVLENEEESGSHDLVYLMEKNAELIGTPDVCICCDSGCLDYNSVWLTSTLRGVLNFTLTVETAKQGSHSGLAGGILPDTWRIINLLLARVEDPETGVVIPDFHVEIPEYYLEEAKTVAGISQYKLYSDFHFLPGVTPIG
jgi:acetylornithine deacetylase/succinyl-diaminopimelate desuccinylase-like protein